MPTPTPKPRPNDYPFGSSLNTRSFSAGSGFRFGFNGHEKENEISEGNNYLVFGDFGLDTRLCRRWNIEPKASKYPFVSTGIYVLNKPITFVDPDGNEVQGFSVNENGDVIITKLASMDAIKIYNAMSKTAIGAKAFKNFITSETKIKLLLTDKPINGAHGLTEGDKMNKNGAYINATVTISTAKTGDRFDLTSTDDEIINVVGAHESVHATNTEQIKKDNSLPQDATFTWEQESIAINTEYSAWKEWRKQNNQDIEPIRKRYENPSDKKDDLGNPKPAQYGIDDNGKVLDKPEKEK